MPPRIRVFLCSLGVVLLGMWLLPVSPLRIGPLDAENIVQEQGNAFAVDLESLGVDAVSDAEGTSELTLLEDGKRLLPHQQHDSIRQDGRGRFSHWQSTLYFASSDNSDSRSNGRSYVLEVPQTAIRAILGHGPWANLIAWFAVLSLAIGLPYRTIWSRSPRILAWAPYFAWMLALWQLAVICWFGAEQAIGPDAGFYLMNALHVSADRVPYRDFEFMYPPGVFYLQDALFGHLARSAGTVFATLLAHHLLVAAGICCFLRVAVRSNATCLGFATAAYFFALPAYEAFQFVLEPLGSPWGWFGLALTLRVSRAANGTPDRPSQHAAPWSRRGWLLIVAGVMVGAAAFVKQAGWGFVGAAVLIAAVTNRRRVLAATLVIVGAILWPVLFVLQYPDAIASFWHQNVVLLFSFARGKYAPGAVTLAERLSMLMQHRWIWGVLVAALLVAGSSLLRKRETRDLRDWVLLILATVGCCYASLSLVRHYLHYHLWTIPFSIVCGGILFARMRTRLAPATILVTIAAMGLLVLPPLVSLRNRALHARSAPDNGFQREQRIAHWIREQAGNRERIMIVPESPQYYYLAGYDSPAHYYHFFHEPEHFDVAKRDGMPVFVIHLRPHHPDYREELRRRGFRLATRHEADVECWRAPQ